MLLKVTWCSAANQNPSFAHDPVDQRGKPGANLLQDDQHYAYCINGRGIVMTYNHVIQVTGKSINPLNLPYLLQDEGCYDVSSSDL